MVNRIKIIMQKENYSILYEIQDDFHCKYRELIRKKSNKNSMLPKIKTKKELNEFYTNPVSRRAMVLFQYLCVRKKIEYDSSPDKWLEANMVSISKNDKNLMQICNSDNKTFYETINFLVDNGYLLKPKKGVYFLSPEYVDFLNKKQKEQMRLDESQKLVNKQLEFACISGYFKYID